MPGRRSSAKVEDVREAETNRDLDPDDPGSIYGATTSLGLDFTALTPTTQWSFETGAALSAFGGDGDTEGLDGAFPNFAAAVAHDGQYVDTGASFALDYQPVAFAQLDDTGITEGERIERAFRSVAEFLGPTRRARRRARRGRRPSRTPHGTLLP